ncbi:MAG: hypothetical protein NTY19_07250 [Planctomycetota bacterium]|nr:hypothetical protein [Planctomycetota bacterium]
MHAPNEKFGDAIDLTLKDTDLLVQNAVFRSRPGVGLLLSSTALRRNVVSPGVDHAGRGGLLPT